MLRNRSKAVSSKQGLIGPPRFFNGFSTKTMFDSESLISPKSILDSQISSSFHNPFGYDKNLSKPTNFIPEISNKLKLEGIGVALIDSINYQENDEDVSKPISRMIMFGTNLHVKIPSDHHIHPSAPSPSESLTSPADFGIKAPVLCPFSLPSPAESPKSVTGFRIKRQYSPVLGPPPPHSAAESPKSPVDFGIKTRNSSFSSPNSGIEANNSPQKAFTKQLSFEEMELSEDYTCVITRGPNPKTTHIFDNSIIESCCGGVKLSENKTKNVFSRNCSHSPSMDFLSFCYTCKVSLGPDKDTYMYRGEKAFCSHECRCQEMCSEGMKNSELDFAF
ncbi:protein MARD1-like [Olea europaea var. sylvestris]|uniref:FLZ-type domain-containing protein n=1 Tax=Olea europaea subsp. europaea TaxID=158383 RepID=A0A8S0QLF6_OLEEU|nr:protein MARD1-like [Olea europaea var. sylvestris]CAA2970082.1 Hypothetical predicted protein [Olea europaea subsp. europaea]